MDFGGESRLGEPFLLEEPLPLCSLASPLLLSLLPWRLCDAFDRQEVIFERLPVRRDEVLESGTLGVGEVPAVVTAGAVVSSPSSLRAVEEEEEKDFRTMRCQVSRIAMLGCFQDMCVFAFVCNSLSVRYLDLNLVG